MVSYVSRKSIPIMMERLEGMSLRLMARSWQRMEIQKMMQHPLIGRQLAVECGGDDWLGRVPVGDVQDRQHHHGGEESEISSENHLGKKSPPRADLRLVKKRA